MQPITFTTRLTKTHGRSYVNTGYKKEGALAAYVSLTTNIYSKSIAGGQLTREQMHRLLAQHFTMVNKMTGTYIPKIDADGVICMWSPIKLGVLLHAGEPPLAPLHFSSRTDTGVQVAIEIANPVPSPQGWLPAPIPAAPVPPPPVNQAPQPTTFDRVSIDELTDVRVTFGGRGGGGKGSQPLVDLTKVEPTFMHIDDVELSMYQLPRESGFAPVRYGVRLHHKPSGLEAQCGSKRGDHANREVAWNVLDNLVRNWFYEQTYGAPIDPTLYGVPLTAEQAQRIKQLAGGSSANLAKFEKLCSDLLRYIADGNKTTEQKQACLAYLLKQT